mmetsp:Transcript_12277/g.28390  ORF Transcript_12277/g.28390 Transcript_12277/m.28390 type:complete len:308 (+) Transcript_12277:1519-2442(+)
MEFERPFAVFSLLAFVVAVLPTFMMRLFTAAWATDLKSASVGGFDKMLVVGADVGAEGTVASEAFFFRATVATGCAADTVCTGSLDSCLIHADDGLGEGVTAFVTLVAAISVFTFAGTVVLTAGTGAVVVVPLLFGSVNGFGVFFFFPAFLFAVPLTAVFCCLDLATVPTFLRFDGEPGFPGALDLRFVPPGVVTTGGVATAGAGDIMRSGDRLVEEITLAAFPETVFSGGGCTTVGATSTCVDSVLGSSMMRLLKEVEGRKAPKPSSSRAPSFFTTSLERSEGPSKDGISRMTSSSSSPPPTTAAL